MLRPLIRHREQTCKKSRDVDQSRPKKKKTKSNICIYTSFFYTEMLNSIIQRKQQRNLFDIVHMKVRLSSILMQQWKKKKWKPDQKCSHSQVLIYCTFFFWRLVRQKQQFCGEFRQCHQNAINRNKNTFLLIYILNWNQPEKWQTQSSLTIQKKSWTFTFKILHRYEYLCFCFWRHTWFWGDNINDQCTIVKTVSEKWSVSIFGLNVLFIVFFFLVKSLLIYQC